MNGLSGGLTTPLRPTTWGRNSVDLVGPQGGNRDDRAQDWIVHPLVDGCSAVIIL